MTIFWQLQVQPRKAFHNDNCTARPLALHRDAMIPRSFLWRPKRLL